MNDSSAVLAALDRFIEQFGLAEKSAVSHRVATQNEPMATINPLTSEGRNHSGHSGHHGASYRDAAALNSNGQDSYHTSSYRPGMIPT
jgi:hypothetical protein